MRLWFYEDELVLAIQAEKESAGISVIQTPRNLAASLN
jgi:hypothetical protein